MLIFFGITIISIIAMLYGVILYNVGDARWPLYETLHDMDIGFIYWVFFGFCFILFGLIFTCSFYKGKDERMNRRARAETLLKYGRIGIDVDGTELYSEVQAALMKAEELMNWAYYDVPYELETKRIIEKSLNERGLTGEQK